MNSATSNSKYPAITLLVILMVVTVFILGQSFRQGQSESNYQSSGQAEVKQEQPIAAEAEVFKGLKQVTRFIDQETVSTRTLLKYYERRAYPGAPPHIPHPIDQDMKSSFTVCSACHAKGGFVPKFQAYAPVTPHPEYSNCRQCHVPRQQEDLFVASNWQRATPPSLGRAALAGGPPPIPHALQMRENCSACHTGPAAPLEIRTSHPERIYCRQCHVPAQTTETFSR